MARRWAKRLRSMLEDELYEVDRIIDGCVADLAAASPMAQALDGLSQPAGSQPGPDADSSVRDRQLAAFRASRGTAGFDQPGRR